MKEKYISNIFNFLLGVFGIPWMKNTNIYTHKYRIVKLILDYRQ